MGGRNNSLSALRPPLGALRPPLGALRRRAAFLLLAEQALRAAAPALLMLLIYAILALLGLANPLLWLACLLLACGSLIWGAAKMRRPSPAAIDRRIEAASGLRHRPLAALADQPATGDPLSLALWRRHQQNLIASVASAHAGALQPQAAAADPLALRFLLLLLLLAALVSAGAAAPARLAGAFTLPGWPVAAPQVDAWIISPDYAGAAPLVLTPGVAATALRGSRLSVVVNGTSRAPAIQLAGASFTKTALGRTSTRADAVLSHSGRLLVGPWWHRLAAWNIAVAAPVAPVVTLRDLQIAPGGRLTVQFHVADPYGLGSLALSFHVAGHPHALPMDFALPPANGDGQTSRDLSSSPYHGLPVQFSLVARNLAGVAGRYDDPTALVLPGLDLHDPTALALDRLRQALALAPGGIATSAGQLHTLAAAPPSAITGIADLQMAVLAAQMADGGVSAPAAVERLLMLIKQIEAGPDYAAAQALAQADQALQAALQHGLHGRQTPADALASLLQAMQAALAQHLAALRPQAAGNSASNSFDPSSLNRLAAKIADDEAAGRTAQAAQELQQLQAELHALESARPMTAQQAAQSQAAQIAAQNLSKLTQAQAGVLDKTTQGSATPADQASLQSQLAAIRQALAQAQLNMPSLGKAAKAMSDAKAALAQGDAGSAAAAQTAAIQNLQAAAAALQSAGQLAIGKGAGGQPTPGDTQNGDGINGLPDEQFLPGLGQPAPNPAGAVEDQIIQQSAEPGLPAAARRYLQRLLEGN
jgi:hypothetical protein